MLLTLTKYTLTVINEQSDSDRQNEDGTDVKVNKQESDPELKRYLALARGKIMPDGFWYSEGWQSGVGYKVVGAKDKGPSDVIRKNLLYSGISASRQDSLSFHDYTEPEFSFRYRELYAKDAEKFSALENRSTKNYNIDFFCKLIDETYISQEISKIVYNQLYSKELTTPPYLFYSMFDLDFLSRKNYGIRGDEITQLEHILTKINDIFTLNVKVAEEVDMQYKMVNPLFSIRDNNNFSPLFTLEDIDDISNQLSEINISIIRDKINEMMNKYNRNNDYLPNIKDYRLFLRKMKNNDLINNIEFSDEQINRIADTIRNGSRTAFSAVDKEIFVKICKYISKNIEDIKAVDEY
ncbi:hypothetical protein GYN67_09005 [Lactococcus piscium]|uniref:hypothetical protein n=1 Tax=Pseudolactococcus carnosus TaxID=2749961 RepID=UPI001FB978FE|nr:hypothetical protein [Lactococcus carnosus]MCJ1996829.1 hypothetical protein [Lactococcus carnosus]